MNIKFTWLLFLTFTLKSYPQQQADKHVNKNLAIEKFVIIGKSRVWYHKAGKGSAVIFVSGLGDDHTTWQVVEDSVSNFATTLSYDRSGLGKSGYNNEKKDLLSIATELRHLVKAIDLPKPFILVGHSLGCQIVKQYAALYPNDIKGIIFLDPGYNEETLKATLPDSVWRQREKALKKYLPVFNKAQKAELKNANQSAAISDSIKNLPRVPIVLFTATHVNPDFPGSAAEFKIKEQTHILWLKSMPGAAHKIIPQSRHYIQNDDPVSVITEIHRMLN
jgi:pimeloyl-ACP methyl ester carboxylesterase